MAGRVFSCLGRALRTYSRTTYHVAARFQSASLLDAKPLHSASTALLPRMTRDYSAASQSHVQDIKVPVRLYGYHGKVATALYKDAVRSNVLEKVESELKSIVDACKRNPAFRMYLKDPLRTREESVKAIVEFSKEAGLTDITKGLLVLSAEVGKMAQLEKIVEAYIKLAKAHRGEVDVTVTTVIPLPKQEEKDLVEVLHNIAGTGKTVKIENKVDRRILGGLVIEFEDKIFDVSVKRSLDEMTRLLNAPLDLHEL
eukprot:TRINITY_DN29156_c0_g1_i1.p1 TRINITY_DN29156_c0_g1~~TRINITY_DN29156_c0_g1_i1.p1  ORF type:complete len:256 (-),score=40.67 TRINITY_DN29156_c0_g1_i1:354-1121(-)